MIRLAIGVIAFCAVVVITSGHGPGLDPDSMAYVGAATSLAQHGTLRVPSSRWQSTDSTVALTVWPPAFSIAMAIPQKLGASPLNSARIVMAASAAVTATAVFSLLVPVTSILIAAIGVAIVLVTPSFITVHISALSEPLFLSALMLTLLAMARGRALPAGIAAAIALMTRYAGVCAGIAAGLWFLLDARALRTQRVRKSAISLAPSAILGLWWVIRNSRVQVTQAGIKLSYYSGLKTTINEGLHTIASWLAPGLEGGAAFLVAALVIIGIISAAIIAHLRRKSAGPELEQSRATILRATGLLLVCYGFVLVCSRLFVGGSIRFDARILSPAILLAGIGAIVVIGSVLDGVRLRGRLLATAFAAAWILGALSVDLPLIEDAVTDGNDFASSDWRESPMIQWVRSDASGRTLYSNWPAAIYFGSGRTSHDIPNTLNPDTLAFFRRIVTAHRGKFVAFRAVNPDYPPSDSIAHALGLVEERRFPDGTVWRAR